MTLINDFMSLIYPRFCEACEGLLHKNESRICHLCEVKLPRSAFHTESQNPVTMILAGRVPVEKVLCLFLFEKSGKVQKLLHAIKYKNQKELATYLGKWLAEDFKGSETVAAFDAVIPIPLHPKKLKTRGYNQSAFFAKGIAAGLGCQLLEHSLVRTINTPTQTKKRKFERWENVEGVFQLASGLDFKNKHILLVDDVITTGATIDAAWQVLKDVEGLLISVACLAHPPRN